MGLFTVHLVVKRRALFHGRKFSLPFRTSPCLKCSGESFYLTVITVLNGSLKPDRPTLDLHEKMNDPFSMRCLLIFLLIGSPTFAADYDDRPDTTLVDHEMGILLEQADPVNQLKDDLQIKETEIFSLPEDLEEY